MAYEKECILHEEIRRGNEGAFNKAFDFYYVPLCFFANKILHDLDLSRSIVQQVFVDLWIKREKLFIGSLKSYLYQSVRNSALDFIKHKKVEAHYLSSLKNNEFEEMADQVEMAELSEKINRAIQNLPKKCLEVFLLCRFEELKYSEIAERLNISIKTVEMQMGIAMKKLRKELSDYQMIQLFAFFPKKKQSNYRVNANKIV